MKNKYTQSTNREESDKFWNDIIYKNNKLDKEAILNELSDYYFLIKELPKLYCHITGGKLSKLCYDANTLIRESDDFTNQLIEQAIKDYKEESVE